MAHPKKRKKANGGKVSQVKGAGASQREIDETLKFLRMKRMLEGAYAISMRDPRD